MPALLAVPVTALWLVALALRVEVVHHAAAVLLLVLFTWSLLGTRVARALAFPLGYLFLMVPFGEFLVPALMRLTADFAVVAVEASGVPVYQDGYVFSLPSGDFEVIKACSGIRFLMATIAAGTVFAYVAYASLAKRLVFLALCVVVPIVGNLLRAWGVVMIVHLSDMRFAAGGDHILYGTLFYGAVLVAFFVAGARFADVGPGPVAEPARAADPVGRGPAWPPVLVLLLTGAAAVIPWAVAARLPPVDGPLAGMPGLVPGWSEAPAGGSDWQPEFPGARATERARLAGAAGSIDVVVAGFAPLGPQGDLTSSVNRPYADRGFRLLADQRVAEAPPGPVRELVLRPVGGEGGRVVWWWYRVDAGRTAAAREAEWLTLRAFLAGRLPERETIAASATYGADPDEARAALAAFSAAAAAVPGWR
jgi:exosortase A